MYTTFLCLRVATILAGPVQRNGHDRGHTRHPRPPACRGGSRTATAHRLPPQSLSLPETLPQCVCREEEGCARPWRWTSQRTVLARYIRAPQYSDPPSTNVVNNSRTPGAKVGWGVSLAPLAPWETWQASPASLTHSWLSGAPQQHGRRGCGPWHPSRHAGHVWTWLRQRGGGR